jgi:hypothetical protein
LRKPIDGCFSIPDTLLQSGVVRRIVQEADCFFVGFRQSCVPRICTHSLHAPEISGFISACGAGASGSLRSPGSALLRTDLTPLNLKILLLELQIH